ncbi:MAG: MBL fold metallo-hydrolase [Thermoplasmatota archaeon]
MTEIERIAHSSVKIKTEDKNIYIDPFYTDNMPDSINEYYENTEKADILLITHSHHDHCHPETFERLLKDDTRIVAPESCQGSIARNFRQIKPGDTIDIGGIKIKAVHAYNIKRKRDSGEPFHPKGEGVGYLISVKGEIVYHPGDTENIPEMENLGHVDKAFLPIDGHYTMDIDEAVEAAKVINPKKVIPFHERDVDPKDFKRKLESEMDIEVELM